MARPRCHSRHVRPRHFFSSISSHCVSFYRQRHGCHFQTVSTIDLPFRPKRPPRWTRFERPPPRGGRLPRMRERPRRREGRTRDGRGGDARRKRREWPREGRRGRKEGRTRMFRRGEKRMEPFGDGRRGRKDWNGTLVRDAEGVSTTKGNRFLRWHRRGLGALWTGSGFRRRSGFRRGFRRRGRLGRSNNSSRRRLRRHLRRHRNIRTPPLPSRRRHHLHCRLFLLLPLLLLLPLPPSSSKAGLAPLPEHESPSRPPGTRHPVPVPRKVPLRPSNGLGDVRRRRTRRRRKDASS
mmetsp:Transcript_13016/g.24711  ORF Transcript_13016/g.24711 Transcript_13016/m.24711 type:complete len:294 (-) Transcript_13016:63-944(-)